MARPILLSVDGESRRLVEESGAGWYVPPEDSLALCDAVLNAFHKQDVLPTMGMRGRDYVMQHYDRKVLAAEYLQLLAML